MCVNDGVYVALVIRQAASFMQRFSLYTRRMNVAAAPVLLSILISQREREGRPNRLEFI